MPALVEPEHAVGALFVAAEQQTWMPIRVMEDAQPVARKRLVLPRHSTSLAQPVMDPTSNAVWGRLIVQGFATPFGRTMRAYWRLDKHHYSGNGPSRTSTGHKIIWRQQNIDDAYSGGVYQPCGRSACCSPNRPPKERLSIECGRQCCYHTWWRST